MTENAQDDPDDSDPDPQSGAPEARHLIVPETAAGQRLDRFLADAIPDLSRSRIQALLRDGHVTGASGQPVSDASAKVSADTSYTLTLPPPVSAAPEPQAIPLDIVHEDADLIVIAKPAGIVVHPGAGNSRGTLVNALLHHCGDSLLGIGGVARPGIVHRLDKDTSGLLVAAKTQRAHTGLAAAFAAHAVDRRYRAIVYGVPEPVRGTIDRNIGRHPTDRLRFATVPDDMGRHAVTHYRLLAQADMAVALIECRLETGRTHQIRVHMADMGHPIVGDPVYGVRLSAAGRSRRAALPAAKRRAADTFPRQALHAATLGFEHPVSGTRLDFEMPPPQDFAALATALGLG